MNFTFEERVYTWRMDPFANIPAESPILVSACLLGEPCRYDGKSQACLAVQQLATARELVPLCPEQLGGLPTPRTPSERQPDGRVVDALGADRTMAFLAGARASVEAALEHGCELAVLKSRSPSRGGHAVYDGTFSGTLTPGEGVTCAALRAAGLQVMDEEDLQGR